MLYFLCYKSRKSKDINDEDLLDILSVAQEKNRSLGLTGMLLYLDGKFLQVLEGERSAVLGLYDKIVRDRRHAEVVKITEGPLVNRNFPNWCMGFRTLTDQDVKEFQRLNNLPNLTVTDILKEGNHIAVEVMKSFYKHQELDFYHFWHDKEQ
ncbi:MAG: BLUF domain-containing protein [Luteibaculaceae bacterium]